MKNISAISLFSSAGIGDLALRKIGVKVVVANEYLLDRAELFKYNFPDTKMIIGDIRKVKKEIIKSTLNALGGRELDILFATPPCQGMSKNGRGKLLSGIRAGIKPEVDDRNLLILDVIDIIDILKPKTVIIENVPEMEKVIIKDRNENFGSILDILTSNLKDYMGKWEIIEFADYGVPQRRQRLITVFSREENIINNLLKKRTIFPSSTHAQSPSLLQKKWISVLDAISHLPFLDAKNKLLATSDLPFHYVPILDAEKYFWVSNTPTGKGAFDNQCVVCKFNENPTHSASKNKEGINKAHKSTPIRCTQCNALLPRPWVKDGEDYRLMFGFTSAYKRMRGDLPASALTKNLSYACSDQKLHPTQNRVLSLLEAFIIHTLSDFEYHWKRADDKSVSDKTIREVIGESIPPKGLEIIFNHIIKAMNQKNLYLRENVSFIVPFKESYVA